MRCSTLSGSVMPINIHARGSLLSQMEYIQYKKKLPLIFITKKKNRLQSDNNEKQKYDKTHLEEGNNKAL